MVDALISAAAESDLPSLEDSSTIDFVPSHHSSVRFCEFCHSSNTPTWRRGPGGKGSLCNACGIKWRLRKRLKKNEKGGPASPPLTPERKTTTSRPKKRKEVDGQVNAYKRPYNNTYNVNTHNNDDDLYEYSASDLKRKKYYCKYCDQTFSMAQFRNNQQFGAHCSNCSRRPGRLVDEAFVYEDSRSYATGCRSPSTPPLTSERSISSPGTPEHESIHSSSSTSSTHNRDGLLLRLLHVVEHQLVDIQELSEIRDELSELKTELLTREEARKAELSLIRDRFKEEMECMATDFHKSVIGMEELAAHRLLEMERTLRANPRNY